jgi:hypothetical protein
MTTLARIASALIAASTLFFPLSALAETKAPAGHHGHHDAAFPMKADAFKKLFDSRVDKLKDHLEQGLSKRSLSVEQKADIEKSMDASLKELHAAVQKVGADGVVTRDEAKHIKGLSEQLRTRMRAELKGKHASAKAKGGKPSKVAKNGNNKSKAPAASKTKKADKDAK